MLPCPSALVGLQSKEDATRRADSGARLQLEATSSQDELQVAVSMKEGIVILGTEPWGDLLHSNTVAKCCKYKKEIFLA